MRDFKSVEIVRAALHVVAPQKGNLETTEVELSMPLPTDIAEFLSGHVERGLADSQATAAEFVTLGSDRAQGASDEILADPANLVRGSTQLASLLYQASDGDDRVSDGTLAALVCRATDEADIEHAFLALLKLDPSSGYRTTTGTEGGRKKVDLEKELGILPSVDERLQKAAFVRRAEEGLEYRMLLVDRQRKKDVVSDFFLTKFLGAEVVLDATKRTKRLWQATTDARNDVQDDLEPEELLALDRYIQGGTSGTSINLDTFGEALPVPDAIRERINARIARDLPDREFDLDQELTRQLHRRRNFEGDNGLKVSVNADQFASMVTVANAASGNGKVITIRTQSWNERS